MISEIAIKHLALDEVWWLVSPQNPLKPEAGMADLAERVRSAERVAQGAPIRVTDIETDLNTRYTADTLSGLRDLYPWHRFVWLMGADNLIQISRWRYWSSIFHTVPVAVFARPTYSFRAESAKAARRFARYRVKPYAAKRLADMRPPAWVFLKVRLDPTSATELRSRAAEAGAAG